MAKPDLDDGYLRYAHELDAALACADFTKGARIVLRVVFSQLFGPARAETAKVFPSELARASGFDKAHLCRAVRELTESGVLERVADCEYRFVKDYERWTKKGAPRLTRDEVAFARSAPAAAMSYKRTPGANRGTGHASNQQSNGAISGTGAVPIQAPAGANRGTDLVPESAPSGANRGTVPIKEERTRGLETVETKETGREPSRPRAFGPEEQGIIEIATRRWGASNGDRIIGDFLKEYPTGWVRRAMDEMFDALQGDFRPKYLRSILQRFQQEGGPKDRNGFASHRRPEPEIKFHRKGDPL